MSTAVRVGDQYPSMLCHSGLQLLKLSRLKFLEGKRREILESDLVWATQLQSSHFSQLLYTLSDVTALQRFQLTSLRLSGRDHALLVQWKKWGIISKRKEQKFFKRTVMLATFARKRCDKCSISLINYLFNTCMGATLLIPVRLSARPIWKKMTAGQEVKKHHARPGQKGWDV